MAQPHEGRVPVRMGDIGGQKEFRLLMTTKSSHICQQTLTISMNAATSTPGLSQETERVRGRQEQTDGTGVKGRASPRMWSGAGIPLKCYTTWIQDDCLVPGAKAQHRGWFVQSASQACKTFPFAFIDALLLLMGASKGNRCYFGLKGGLAAWHTPTYVGRGVLLLALPGWQREVASKPLFLNIESTGLLLCQNCRERKHFGSYSGKVNVYSFFPPLCWFLSCSKICLKSNNNKESVSLLSNLSCPPLTFTLYSRFQMFLAAELFTNKNCHRILMYNTGCSPEPVPRPLIPASSSRVILMCVSVSEVHWGIICIQ